jgi:hypothetical protein
MTNAHQHGVPVHKRQHDMVKNWAPLNWDLRKKGWSSIYSVKGYLVDTFTGGQKTSIFYANGPTRRDWHPVNYYETTILDEKMAVLSAKITSLFKNNWPLISHFS